MKTAIIITTPDHAGLNIKEHLLKIIDFRQTSKDYAGYPVYRHGDTMLYTTDTRCIYLENIDKEIDADLFIIPTTHRSEAKKRTLSCHTQGNWAAAELGGSERTLSIAPAFYLKRCYQELCKVTDDMKLDYEPTLECTHHGPDIDKPTIFVEIGSTETEWKDSSAGEAIAKVVTSLLEFDTDTAGWRSTIGIGGPHYCSTFNKIMVRTDIAIGHICPKYMLEALDESMIRQAIENTSPTPGLIILDWKGLGQHKERIKDILKNIGLPYERTDRLLK